MTWFIKSFTISLYTESNCTRTTKFDNMTQHTVKASTTYYYLLSFTAFIVYIVVDYYMYSLCQGDTIAPPPLR